MTDGDGVRREAEQRLRDRGVPEITGDRTTPQKGQDTYAAFPCRPQHLTVDSAQNPAMQSMSALLMVALPCFPGIAPPRPSWVGSAPMSFQFCHWPTSHPWLSPIPAHPGSSYPYHLSSLGASSIRSLLFASFMRSITVPAVLPGALGVVVYSGGRPFLQGDSRRPLPIHAASKETHAGPCPFMRPAKVGRSR
eukprot:gene8906-biopygen8025